ncbi:hypothetical protein WAI453_002201 [Rhynchosporium graminicola]
MAALESYLVERMHESTFDTLDSPRTIEPAGDVACDCACETFCQKFCPSCIVLFSNVSNGQRNFDQESTIPTLIS